MNSVLTNENNARVKASRIRFYFVTLKRIRMVWEDLDQNKDNGIDFDEFRRGFEKCWSGGTEIRFSYTF